jgi:hypothetical protein
MIFGRQNCGFTVCVIGNFAWQQIAKIRVDPASSFFAVAASIPPASNLPSFDLKTALNGLARQPRHWPWVFGNARRSFNNWGTPKPQLPVLSAGWRIHDLRRSAATGLANLGTLPHVIKAVLNHVSGHRAGVAGIYNRATYAKEMRAAPERWAEHVEKVTRGLS